MDLGYQKAGSGRLAAGIGRHKLGSRRLQEISGRQGSVVKDQVRARLPDEVLDRPEVHVGVQNLEQEQINYWGLESRAQ